MWVPVLPPGLGPAPREQCLLRVESDTLWNGPRLVKDRTGRRDWPESELAFMEHLLCASAVPGLGDSAKSLLLRACILMEEDREETREGIRK